jgi:hypothetical protein
MDNDRFGPKISFLEALNELHLAMELNYGRGGMSISLEPDAFFRVINEISEKQLVGLVHEQVLNLTEMTVYTAMGPILVKKDESLDGGYFRKISTGTNTNYED